MSFVSSIVGGILGSNAAGNAADAGVTGAQKAQGLELQNQTAANAAQQTALGNVTAANQPYQSLGSTSASSLNNLLQKGFQAPTLAQAQATPGYQFQLQQGTQAIDENAAANGTLMTGNTGTALQNYGQNLAQGAYQQTYNNALNSYMTNYQTLQGGTNTGLSSTGQLDQANMGTASNTASIDMQGGQQQAQQINNAAAARASGYMAQNQAIQGMIGGLSGGFSGGMGNLDSTGGSSGGEQATNFAMGMLGA
jgi:hypothetical protein